MLEQYEVNGGPRDVWILYSVRNYLSIKVRSFIDFAVSLYCAPVKSPDGAPLVGRGDAASHSLILSSASLTHSRLVERNASI